MIIVDLYLLPLGTGICLAYTQHTPHIQLIKILNLSNTLTSKINKRCICAAYAQTQRSLKLIVVQSSFASLDRGAAERSHGKVEHGHRWGSAKAERGHRWNAGERSAVPHFQPYRTRIGSHNLP
jgi:hypothetical protein